MSLAPSSMRPTASIGRNDSRRSVSYSSTPAVRVPMTPPTIATRTSAPTGAMGPRRPPEANSSAADGTVTEPMSSSDGKKFGLSVVSMTSSTAM